MHLSTRHAFPHEARLLVSADRSIVIADHIQADAVPEVELGPGGMLHVESTTARRVTNPGPDELVMLVVGAKEGYVGRDGQPAAPKAFLRDVDAD